MSLVVLAIRLALFFIVTHTHTHVLLFFSSLSVLALGPTVILRVYSCLDLGLETGGLHCVGLVTASLFLLYG